MGGTATTGRRAGGIALVVVVAPAPVCAQATTYYVASTDGASSDTTDCTSATNATGTLRGALAVATSGMDTIAFISTIPAATVPSITLGGTITPGTSVAIDDTGAGTRDGRSGRSTVGADPSKSRPAAGRENRGLSRLPGVSSPASSPDTYDERIGAAQRRDQAAHVGGAGYPPGRSPNAEACLRLVTALCVEQSEEWVSGRHYLDMSGCAAGETGFPGVL